MKNDNKVLKTQENLNKKILLWDKLSVLISIPVLIIIFACIGTAFYLYSESESQTTTTTSVEEDVETVTEVTTYVPAVIEEVPNICTRTLVYQNNELIDEQYTDCIEKESMSKKEILFDTHSTSIILLAAVSIISILVVIASRLYLKFLSNKFDKV